MAKSQVTLDNLFNPPLSILDVAAIAIELFSKEGLKTYDESNQPGRADGLITARVYRF